MYIHLSPPPEEIVKAEREVGLVESFFKSRKTVMSASKRKKLDKYIKDRIESIVEKTSTLRARLKENLTLMEGELEPTDYPFGVENSSQIDIRLAASRSRTLRANFIRSALSDPNMFVAEMMPGHKKEADTNLVEAAVNWLASHETNLIEALKDTPGPIFRDGTSLLYGEWERRIEKGNDYRSYEEPDKFTDDYPDAEAAGITEERYNEILEHLSGDEAELHVEFELDFVAQNGPIFSTFPLAKFLWWPLHISKLEDSELYGYYFPESSATFRKLTKQGFYDSEPAEESEKTSGTSEWSDWDAHRDKFEGIDSEDDQGEVHTIAKIVVAWDPGDKGVTERYLVYYEMDKKKSLRVEPYGRWRNIPSIIPFSFLKRDGRLIGISMASDGRFLVQLVNALHRHRSNNRRLVDSVTLILPKSLKDELDLGAEYAEFRPGMTFWVPDQLMEQGKIPRQFKIENMSRTENLDEESLAIRYLDGLWGVTEGQSGRESSIDPSAPASKTRELLARADFRTEDLVEQWRRSIPPTIDLLTALYYENAPAKIPFLTRTGDKSQESKIATALLADPRRRFVLKSVRSTATPEFEMNKIAATVAMAFQMQFPVRLKPEIIIELWNDYLIASRIELPERFQIKIGENGKMSMGGQEVDGKQLLGIMQQMGAEKEAQRRGPKTKGGRK